MSKSIDCDNPSNVRVNVSKPSVVLSSAAVMVIVAALLVTVKLPVNDTSMSAASTPVIV